MNMVDQTNPICICMAGSFPPPVTGMTLSNAAMRQYISSLKVDFIEINLSPKALNRVWSVRLFRFIRVLGGLTLYLRVLIKNRSKKTTLYICLSGGYGQFYEILFVVLSKLFKARMFFHHRCSSYLEKPLWRTQLLTQVAGSEAVHIVLCDEMGNRLKKTYSSVQNLFVLSNATLMEESINPTSIEPKTKLKKIAFLGNITAEKGIFEFLEVAEILQQEGLDIRALVAGPFHTPEIKTLFFEHQSCLKTVEYLGSKYGEEKSAFYREIDVLLFPTKYANEAEPRTIHEAMAHGVPVIAWGRGCIPSQIPPNTGLVIEPTKNFVTGAVEQIKLWEHSSAVFQATSKQAIQQFLQMKELHEHNLEKLLVKLSSLAVS